MHENMVILCAISFTVLVLLCMPILNYSCTYCWQIPEDRWHKTKGPKIREQYQPKIQWNTNNGDYWTGFSFPNEAGGIWPLAGGDNLGAQRPFEHQRREFDCKISFSCRWLSSSLSAKVAVRWLERNTLIVSGTWSKGPYLAINSALIMGKHWGP